MATDIQLLPGTPTGPAAPPPDPAELRGRPATRARVDRFYRERYFGDWGGRDLLAGATPGPDAIVLQSNDYLHLARDRRIVGAQVDALERAGNGAMMSATFLKDEADPLLRLEQRFARCLGTDRALLCPSGWHANVGLLQSIAGPGEVVYLDSIAHMSLWEGARAAGATCRPFRHNTPEHLRTRIRKHGPGIVVVDSVYSTNGSVCPLAEVVSVAAEHGCVTVVDESHSLGTHGPQGAGMVAELGLTGAVDFITASLAKAFVGRAGLITCGSDVPTFLRYTSPPAIFSSTLLPHDIAGLDAALTVIGGAEARRARLRAITTRVRGELAAAGIDLSGGETQIVALPAGTETEAPGLRDALEARGIFGALFVPPATSARRTLVRLSLHAGLTDVQVERIITVARSAFQRPAG